MHVITNDKTFGIIKYFCKKNMRKFYVSFFLSLIIILNSCTTTLVSAKKNNEIDDVLKIGKSYTFFTNDGMKKKFTVSKIEDEKILGLNEAGEKFELEKSSVIKINKANVTGTLSIVVGVVAAAIIVPSVYQNKPIGR